jgi:hypothetical protein
LTNGIGLKAYYYLLQIAHIILQVLEVSSLLRDVAAEFGRTPGQLFGSLKNLARHLPETFRYIVLSDNAFDYLRAGSTQIRFDTSQPTSSVFRVTRYQSPEKLVVLPLAVARDRAPSLHTLACQRGAFIPRKTRDKGILHGCAGHPLGLLFLLTAARVRLFLYRKTRSLERSDPGLFTSLDSSARWPRPAQCLVRISSTRATNATDGLNSAEVRRRASDGQVQR